MEEDETLDLNNESDIEAGRQNNRFKDLSDKVKTTAKERDDAAMLAKESESKRLEAEKERDFFKDFSTASSKYQGAAEYQDQILEKVKAGYDVEDAMVSVLAKEGKLTAPIMPKDSPAGGSATTALKGDGEKSVYEMDQAERRKILEENMTFS